MAEKIVILGAGLTGLSCAYHLRKDYAIYERENEPGGLCRSNKKDGFVFDCTGHLLHFKTPYAFKRKLGFSYEKVMGLFQKYLYTLSFSGKYPFLEKRHSQGVSLRINQK
jgi:phytoene dehydrogenase-like protein